MHTRRFFVPSLLLASAIFMCSLLFPLSQSPLRKLPIISPPGLAPDFPLPKEVDCIASDEVALPILARAIHEQVGDRPFAVQVAFGAVMVNRRNAGGFGSGISAVLSSAGIFPTDRQEPTQRSLRAAREALSGSDPTFGALFILSETSPSLEEYKDRIRSRIDGLVFIG